MGKPCVAGAEGITVDVDWRQARVGEYVIHEGDVITLNGATGEVYLGAIPTLEAQFSDDLKVLLGWVVYRFQLFYGATQQNNRCAVPGVGEGSQTGEQSDETDQGFLDVDRYASSRWLHQNLSAGMCKE